MTYPTKQTAAQAFEELQKRMIDIRNYMVEERAKIATGPTPSTTLEFMCETIDARVGELDALAATPGLDEAGVREYPDRMGDLLTVEYAATRQALMGCLGWLSTQLHAVDQGNGRPDLRIWETDYRVGPRVFSTNVTDPLLPYMDAVIASIDDPQA